MYENSDRTHKEQHYSSSNNFTIFLLVIKKTTSIKRINSNTKYFVPVAGFIQRNYHGRHQSSFSILFRQSMYRWFSYIISTEGTERDVFSIVLTYARLTRL